MEMIGFIVGIILFIILAIIFLSKFIFNIYFLIILLSFTFVGLIILLLGNFINKKNMIKCQRELSDTLKKYIKVKEKNKLTQLKSIVVLEDFNSDSNFIVGENLIFKDKESLCFFPNYPTLDNYLLYDDIKIIKIPIKNIEDIKIIGKYEKGQDFFSKMIAEKSNIGIDPIDNRRTLLCYQNNEDNKLILDFYAYDKIKEIIK